MIYNTFFMNPQICHAVKIGCYVMASQGSILHDINTTENNYPSPSETYSNEAPKCMTCEHQGSHKFRFINPEYF